jgi:hypothetical protein
MELKVGEFTYRTGVISARVQFHVVRRLAPFIKVLAENVDAFKGAESGNLSGLDQLAEVVAQMPDKDVDFILDTCLAVCERQQGPAWAKVMAPGGRLMFEDMAMPQMLRLVVAVIQENMGGFFPALPSGSKAEAPSPA